MMRKRLSFLFLIVMYLVFAPSVALADMTNGVVFAEQTDNGSNYRVYVAAPDKYSAAIYAVGGDPDYLTSEQRSKLSDPNYGGSFYTYAQLFVGMQHFLELPPWVMFSLPFTATIDEFMECHSTYSQYCDAVEDYKRVLAGEDLGGTPEAPPVTDGEYMYFRGNPLYVDDYGFNYTYYRSGGVNYTLCVRQTQYTLFPAPLVVRVPLSAVSDLLASYPTDSYSWFLYINFYNGAISSSYIFIGNLAVTYDTVNGFEGIKSISGRYQRVTLLNQYFTFDGSTSTFTYTTNGHGSIASSGGTPTSSNINIILGTDSVSAPPAPDGDWPEPETPVTPEPPVVPTPTAPVGTVEPSVSGPSVVWPDITINVEPTPDGLDYTELLTAINNNLNSLRGDLVTEFEAVGQSLRNIYQYLQHLDDVLERHCKHIRDSIDQNVYELELYLKSLFEWLPQQLDYDAQFTYDDSAVTTLLYRILNKIPGSNGSPITYKPNPQSDEPGFLDWLLDLWHRFLIDLVSVLPDELGGLVDTFSQLTHYFPFSIPWDLYALLALFEHEPVTPVFDVPLGFGGGENDVVLIRVDLSAWDPVMAFIRPVFVVGFCIKLALITKDLLSNFDINKGGV